jgi:hypothetical protein
MFGRYYQQRDAALQAATGTGQRRLQLEYASELLSELLNRASVLEDAGMSWFDRSHGADDQDPETQSRLHRFAMAAMEFLDGDCQEARVRGRRLRLFAETADRRVDFACGETEESLAEIGGALVPREEAEEVAHA